VAGLRAAQQSEASVRCQWDFEGADLTTALRSRAGVADYDLTAHGPGFALVPGADATSQALKLPGDSAYAEYPFGHDDLAA